MDLAKNVQKIHDDGCAHLHSVNPPPRLERAVFCIYYWNFRQRDSKTGNKTGDKTNSRIEEYCTVQCTVTVLYLATSKCIPGFNKMEINISTQQISDEVHRSLRSVCSMVSFRIGNS